MRDTHYMRNTIYKKHNRHGQTQNKHKFGDIGVMPQAKCLLIAFSVMTVSLVMSIVDNDHGARELNK